MHALLAYFPEIAHRHFAFVAAKERQYCLFKYCAKMLLEYYGAAMQQYWRKKVPEIATSTIKTRFFFAAQVLRVDMAGHANSWTAVVSSSIEKVMLEVQQRLLPQTNITHEVAELRQVYLTRKNILVCMDEAHVTLRHLQQIESRKAAPRAPLQARLPRAAAAVPIATAILPDDPMDFES